MDAKRVTSPARRRLLWAATAAGLIAVTAVVASSVAGATPFFPQTPGYTQPSFIEGTADLQGTGEFPIIYASEATSGDCVPGQATSCHPRPHLFTLTKTVDSFTPALAQAAITGANQLNGVITIHVPSNGKLASLITYDLGHVVVVDDHQVFEKDARGGGTIKELITLRYKTIRWTVGNTKTGYDWATGQKI